MAEETTLAEAISLEDAVRILLVRKYDHTIEQAQTSVTNLQLRKAYAEYAEQLVQKVATELGDVAAENDDLSTWGPACKLEDTANIVGLKIEDLKEVTKRIKALNREVGVSCAGAVSERDIESTRYGQDVIVIAQWRRGGQLDDNIISHAYDSLPTEATRRFPKGVLIEKVA